MFFDVGDTLVEGWAPRERINELTRAALVEAFGERDWYDAFVGAEFGPGESAELHRQETNRWVEEWFINSGYGLDDVAVDRLRSAGSVPLDLVGQLVPGATEALRWAKSKGLAIGLAELLYSGSPALRRPSTSVARFSGRWIGSQSAILERRNLGSSWRK